MRKKNDIKKYDRLVVNKQCGEGILYIIYERMTGKLQETEKNFWGIKYGSEDQEKILAFSGLSDKIYFRHEKSFQSANQKLISSFEAVVILVGKPQSLLTMYHHVHNQRLLQAVP